MTFRKQLSFLNRIPPDVVLAVVVAAILGAMIAPLPSWLLDAGIAINLAASMLLLVAALFARNALQVASFPTLLLITTLFRLALNVSSTRLALAEGHAGDIIQSFGEFVVGGDYVVGAVVFVILTLVQFLVVAKGAERVAEVSARFTLDAMPGKQMSIDADLRAGAIDMAQARARRHDLERESQMFGAMDGAMKFVKGDVIAGMVIVLVNLIGGTVIGVVQNGLRVSEAAATYALLSIGDGLVSQIPSLCVTVAAGLVVTRVSAEREGNSLGADVGVQFFGQWKALLVVAGLCLVLAMMPGMPALLFLLLGGAAIAGAYGLSRRQGALNEEASHAPAAASPSERGAPASHEVVVGVAPFTIDLSPSLSAFVQEDGGKWVREELDAVRAQVFAELGVEMPSIRVRTDASYLPAGGYSFLVDEVPCGSGKLQPSAYYAVAGPEDLAFLEVDGEALTDPASGRPICAISAELRGRLELAQVVVRSPRQQLCAHLATVLRQHASAMLGVQEAQRLVDALERQAPALVKETLGKVPLPLLTDVLRRLLEERVSIRNLRVIFEALVCPTTEGDASALAERCRQALHRYLTHKYAPHGPLYAYLVDPSVEELFRSGGAAPALEPEQAQAILQGVRDIASDGRAVLLSSPDIRKKLRRLVEGAFPEVAVLTYGELDPDLQIRPLGRLAGMPN